MDHIFIRDLRIEMLIGFHRREQLVPQAVRLDVEIGIGDDRVYEGDRVADCIDYDKVTARIRELALARHYNLVETFADHVARILVDEFGAARASVEVAKLGVLKDAGLVGVRVERSR